ncbi:hypothetical protein EKL98_12315 [Flavobacterium bomense]|uniref:Carboxypeptidase regulatory-like domain-containing protein n=2 Tax=Flavobacterium TaxID=237 RepID=A0A3S0PV40_9FLAO|nr:hypothetical protein [Flavobacterium bomense]RTZ03048.1 hypothetical protein EKL98_12315 [Flavobacterium bomense]RTZ05391.1 hypothetical protein EKM03_09170 [Flavobacterium sp. GSP6]
MFSQNNEETVKSKIGVVLKNYFKLDREAIHIHVNKSTFLSEETIWYQGYIVTRKTTKPFYTSNVFVLLLDEKGKQLSEKLVFADNGVFSGHIKLGPNLDSGNYYIQVYTNWMNNFTENESTLVKVNIINPDQGIQNTEKIVKETLKVYLNPEGKNLISGVSNTIGIQVKDCNNNTPINLEATIQNSKGEALQTVKLNNFGFGKFHTIPTTEVLTVAVKYEDKIIENNLPPANLIGVAIEASSFMLDNKTKIKVKTNKSSFNSLQFRGLNLVIHQDQNFIVEPLNINPNNLEQIIVVNNTGLNPGINTIRIIDNELKQWSERQIYISPITKNNYDVIKNNQQGNIIKLAAFSNSTNNMISISVLPVETKSIDDNNSIIAGLTINPYLKTSLLNSNYYLNDVNRLKYYELDLALLNQESLKYDWDYMKLQPPTAHYTFDIGINLKGTVANPLKSKSFHKVKLVSSKEFITASADVTENGTFEFQNLLLTDSTYVNLSLHKQPNFEYVDAKLALQVVNRKKLYNKVFTGLIKKNCNLENDTIKTVNLDLPYFKEKAIQLKEVVSKNKKKQLTHINILSNRMLRGHKIDSTNNSSRILNFIEQNGFMVDRTIGKINIYSRLPQLSVGPPPTPIVYIDDRQLYFDYYELEFLKMDELDEIYINALAIVAGGNNNLGIIRIYTKKQQNTHSKKSNPNSFFVKDAFSKSSTFQNLEYENASSNGFNNFGTINWFTKTISDSNGNFTFDILDYNKKNCKIIIEGMTTDGQIFHEEKVVQLK